MQLEPHKEGHTIVLAGDFNPAIFQPRWLSSLGLIRNGEAEAAVVEVIHREVAIFSLDWCKFTITGERLLIETTQKPFFEIARDLIVSILLALPHTPIRALGINWEKLYAASSEESWHRFGHLLVPKENWASLVNPGTLRVTIRGSRNSEIEGFRDVTVESVQGKSIPWGVRILVNDHYAVAAGDYSAKTAERAAEIISKNWMTSQSETDSISESLIEKMK